MRIVEGEDLEIWQSIEVQHFLEAADLVACDVQIGKVNQGVKTGLDRVYLISRDPQLLQTHQSFEILDGLYLVVADPQSLQVDEPAEALDGFDVIVREIHGLEGIALVQSFDLADLILIEPERFQLVQVCESLDVSKLTSMAAMPQLISVSDLSPLKRLRTCMELKSSSTSSMVSILSNSFQTLSLKPFIRF